MRGRFIAEEHRPHDAEPAVKRARTDPFAETDEDVDILATPRIEPSTHYPPKMKNPEAPKELPAIAPPDPVEEAQREARSRRVAEMIQKQIVMAGPGPSHCVDGLVDVIDETEELCYIDNSIPMETFITQLAASAP
jgi:hypothetical protein